jgi:hypothetical protein
MIRRYACVALLLLAGCASQQPARSPFPAPTAPIPAAPPRGEPGEYLNMSEARLQVAFGKPAFVRKDGATQMWRYDGTACRAFFFLYGAPLAVRHVETLPHSRSEAADTACLTALRTPASLFPS